MSKKREFDAEWLQWQEYQQFVEPEHDFITSSLTDITGLTKNAVFPDHINKKNYQPRTLVDQTLEIVDPTPDINQLFVQFNANFFYNVLLPVTVRWSKVMTSCAGVCTFHPRNGECVIALSAPLLKLRPRKDLVETLLHEMIHAYLFLTQNNRDRDGHGPEFCKHMNRINAKTGTNITIYHDFHAEVALYKQHWWKCDGPCQFQRPYYGIVKRAMNRAPGPSDSWHQQHKNRCGGTFTKIKEPEKPKKEKKSTSSLPTTKVSQKKPDGKSTAGTKGTLDKWLSPPKDKPKSAIPNGSRTDNIHGFGTSSSGTSQSKKSDKVGSSGLTKLGTNTNNVHGWGTSGPEHSASPPAHKSANPKFKGSGPKTDKTESTGLTKLGTSTNNVHGWGTGGPGSSNSRASNGVPSSPINPRFRESGVLGGKSGSGRSCLLDKLSPPIKIESETIDLRTPEPKKPRLEKPVEIRIDECPICHYHYLPELINDHVEECLALGDAVVINPNMGECPICGNWVKTVNLEQHVDKCISTRERTEREEIEKQGHHCLICRKFIPPEMDLGTHLEVCLKLQYPDSGDEDD